MKRLSGCKDQGEVCCRDSPSGWKLYRSLPPRDMSNSGFVRVKDTPLLLWSSCVSMLSRVQSALHFLSRALITHTVMMLGKRQTVLIATESPALSAGQRGLKKEKEVLLFCR